MSVKKKIVLTTIILIVLIIVAVAVPFYLHNPETETLNEQSRSNTSGKYLSLSQGITHYEIAGPDTAETVVLVHGFSVPYYIWDSTFVSLVANGYRVVRYDTYGRGYSDRLTVDYEKEVYDRQLSDLIEALQLKLPVHLIGLSFGGPVTSYFTAHHPEKVKTLTLVDPAVKSFEKPAVPEWFAHYYSIAFGLSGFTNQSSDFQHPENFPGWNEKYLEQMKYKGFVRGLLSTRYHYQVDPAEQFKIIAENKTPVMLIWGKQDPTIPFSDNVVANEILHPRFLAIDDCGHLPHMEKPGVMMPELLDFLKGN